MFYDVVEIIVKESQLLFGGEFTLALLCLHLIALPLIVCNKFLMLLGGKGEIEDHIIPQSLDGDDYDVNIKSDDDNLLISLVSYPFHFVLLRENFSCTCFCIC